MWGGGDGGVGGVCESGENRGNGRGKPPPLRELGSVRCFCSDGRNGNVGGGLKKDSAK